MSFRAHLPSEPSSAPSSGLGPDGSRPLGGECGALPTWSWEANFAALGPYSLPPVPFGERGPQVPGAGRRCAAAYLGRAGPELQEAAGAARGPRLSGAPAPRRPRHSGCDRAAPVAEPCAPGSGLRFGPVRGLGGSGAGHTSSLPGPRRRAPAESPRGAEGTGGAADVSARSPGARLCARAERGRAVTRRARRIPDSRPPLRPPRTSSHRSPGSSRRRTVSTRVWPPATPAPCACSFFRLVPIWVLAAVVFIILPKDSIPSLPLLSASRLVAPSKLTPQTPGAGEGSASSRAAAPGRCVQLVARAFRSGPRNPVPFLGPPFSWLWGPEPPPLRKAPRGPQTLSLGRTRSALGAPFTACGQGTLADFGNREDIVISQSRGAPPPPSPPHACLRAPGERGGAGLASAGELGQWFCLLRCCKGLQRERRARTPLNPDELGQPGLKYTQGGDAPQRGSPEPGEAAFGLSRKGIDEEEGKLREWAVGSKGEVWLPRNFLENLSVPRADPDGNQLWSGGMEALTTQLGPGREGNSSPTSKQELQPYSGSSALKPNQVGETSLYGVPIVSLVIDGQERLCLAQISNTLLKNYSYNEIHNRRVALGITCVQCTPVQLEILRRAGAMPISSRRCGMITKREAERLCKSFLGEHKPPKLPENFAFDVVHECAWGSRGSFIPARYNSSRAKCIKCGYCSMYFSPNKFIFHSHLTPDAKYTQPDAANFNSWRRHLKHSYKSATDELSLAWEDLKLQLPLRLSEVDTADEPEVDVFSNRFPDEDGAPDEAEPGATRAPSAGGGADNDQPAGPPSAASSGADGPTDSPDGGSPRPRRRPGLPSASRPAFGDLAADDVVRRPERSPPSGGYELREPCGPLGGPAPAKPDAKGVIYAGTLGEGWREDAGKEAGEGGWRVPPGTGSPGSAREPLCLPDDPETATGGAASEGAGRSGPARVPLGLGAGPAALIRFQRPPNPCHFRPPQVYAPERDEHVKSAAALGPAASYLCAPEAHEPDKEDNHSTADDLETRKSYPDQRSISQPSPANTDRGEDGLTLDVTGTQLVEKDIENLARDELQKLLLEQMELRKKLEREFQSLKDNFQDQMKRELAYREEMVQQLQIVRDTLCNELDQERKARYAIQQKLKEAHDALHHFSCKMLTPRHCTGNCSFKPPLLP
eukprot:XP_022268430.1 LOW QUALITY PROTEIN: SKI family transcriptional corepressor 1 [Canis lupus familiaris]